MLARLAMVSIVPIVLATATPAVASSLDREVIRRPIRRGMPKISRCYEKRLLENPTLGEGRVTASFTVASTGRVVEATAIGFDQGVADCVARVIRTLRFPRSTAATIRVSYPFDFRH